MMISVFHWEPEHPAVIRQQQDIRRPLCRWCIEIWQRSINYLRRIYGMIPSTMENKEGMVSGILKANKTSASMIMPLTSINTWDSQYYPMSKPFPIPKFLSSNPLRRICRNYISNDGTALRYSTEQTSMPSWNDQLGVNPAVYDCCSPGIKSSRKCPCSTHDNKKYSWIFLYGTLKSLSRCRLEIKPDEDYAVLTHHHSAIWIKTLIAGILFLRARAE